MVHPSPILWGVHRFFIDIRDSLSIIYLYNDQLEFKNKAFA